MQNIIEHITEAFIEALENGENPFWVKPWNGRVVMPRNFVTGKTYRGMEDGNLWCALTPDVCTKHIATFLSNETRKFLQ